MATAQSRIKGQFCYHGNQSAQTMKLHASTRVGRLKERRVNLPLVIATSRLRDHQNTAAAIRDSRTKGVKPFPMKITIKAHKIHSHGMNQQGNKAQKITARCTQSLMTALQQNALELSHMNLTKERELE